MTPDWMREGACRVYDPELFFPEKTGREPVKRPKEICNKECPVVTQCLAYALEHGEIYGVWGGLAGSERIELMKYRPTRSRSSPHTGTIRHLAGLGWSDPDIARHVGIRAETVLRIRKRAGITAGKQALSRRSLGRTG